MPGGGKDHAQPLPGPGRHRTPRRPAPARAIRRGRDHTSRRRWTGATPQRARRHARPFRLEPGLSISHSLRHAPSLSRLLVLALVGLAVSPSSSAGTLDPARLVLRQSDVPSTYRLNRDKSGARTTKIDSVDSPELKTKYPAWGRLVGYQVTFEKASDSIVSRADLFRTGTGG